MTNKEVAQAFAEGRSGKAGNLRSTGSQLISYGTCIGVWHNGEVILSEQHFSQTTACHLGLARRACGKVHYSDCFKYGSTSFPDPAILTAAIKE